MVGSKSYRPDIDGLRAVAVLAVVISHAGFEFFSGGFVGVDIFFVISGYLITRIIYSEAKKNKFTLKGFYLRRIKRILPAFYFASTATLIAGYFLMLPSDFESLGKSFVASAFFWANIFFMTASDGYFSDAAHEMPLLHIWSLSVEEQFYFFWPLMLGFFANRASIRLLLCIITVLILISFGIAEYWATSSPKLSYYHTASRASELLVGALLAVATISGKTLGRTSANFASVAGLLLIFGSIILIDEHTRFPGINAFWPCLGAVLVILAGNHESTLSFRILSNRAMVSIGLVSYSIYLWHWPLLAYTRYLQYSISWGLGLCFVLLSICLGYLSWKYIEQPFRHTSNSAYLIFTKRLFVLCSASALLVAFLITNGLVTAFHNDEHLYQSAKDRVLFPSKRNGWCSIDSEDGLNIPFEEKYLGCELGSATADTKGLLWGDSHAGSYAPFVDHLGKQLNISVTEMSTSACPPGLVSNHGLGSLFQFHICKGFREVAAHEIERKKYDVIFVAARWEGYPEEMYGNIIDGIALAAENSKRVIVLSQIPHFEIDVGRCYIRGSILPIYNVCDQNTTYRIAKSVTESNKRIKDKISFIPNTEYLDVSDLLCGGSLCSPFFDQMPAYFDSSHLNVHGSSMLVKKFLATEHGRLFEKRLRELIVAPEIQ